MAGYKDYWNEFRQIQESTKKKLLKKPNYIEAINQYRNLAHEMEAAEFHDQAALCHREMANLYEKLINFPAEKQHLLTAAHLFEKTRISKQKMCMTIVQETEYLMEECYLKVIEKLVKQNFIKMAALTCIEAAHSFLSFLNFDRACHYFIKASKFAQSDIYVQITILNKLCFIATQKSSVEEILSELQLIWTSILKNQTYDGAIRNLLVPIECYILMLNLKHVLVTDDIQKSPLIIYDGKWRQIKQSVLNEQEFRICSDFVRLMREGNYPEGSRVQALKFSPLLSEEGKRLSAEILNSINTLPSIDRGFSDIHSLEDCNELEKRQKMFEHYNNLVRKNQIKLEHL